MGEVVEEEREGEVIEGEVIEGGRGGRGRERW